MKKFKFGLQKVLEVKEIGLKRCQKELAEIDEKTLKAKELLKNSEEKERLFAQTVAGQNRGCAQELERYQQYLQSLFDEVRTQQVELQNIENLRKEQLEKLLKAHRDQKILKNLRQRAYDNFLEKLQNEDQNLMDELATLGSLKT